MAQSQAELVKALVDAGVHFGHRVSRWNPKMQPYIHGKRNMIHLIDVRETMKGLLLAKRLITQTVASGKDVLFVGTKRQAKEAVERDQPGVFWAAHQADLPYSQIERLVALDALPPHGFKVACFPLKVAGGSAGPARVVALLPD